MFHQKILSGCFKICKIRQGITFLPHPVDLVFYPVILQRIIVKLYKYARDLMRHDVVCM